MTQYDAVFLENPNVRGMLEQDSNGRNIASMSWSDAINTFERHGDKNGCYVVTVPPEGPTKRCARCDVETDKALWVREHSYPSCGFEADRDENASYNVLKLGLGKLGVDYDVDAVVGLGEAASTPAETAFPTGADASDNSSFRVVPASASSKQEATGHPTRGNSPCRSLKSSSKFKPTSDLWYSLSIT